MKKICYPCIFHPEEIGYSVSVPDFDKVNYGCFTQGDTFEEACDMAFDAIGLCIEDILDSKMDLPIPTKPEELEKADGDFVVPVVFDMEKYQKTCKTKMVKKTLTIPEWLNALAEEQGVNFSKVLRNALANQLDVSL